MICLLYAGSPGSAAALIFCTCILLPFVEFKNALFSVFRSPAKSYGLPVARFGDLRGGAAEACSVCLAEFGDEDSASKLCRCGHVFHTDCIRSWLDRNQFTCPLCRTFLLEYCLDSS